MDVLVVALLVVNLLALAAVATLVRGQRRRLLMVEETVGDLDAPPPLSPEMVDAFRDGTRRLIAIEILNPMELAAAESKLGGMAGGLAPETIRKIVHERAVRMLEEQLAENGVVAEVRLHVAR